MEYSTGLRTALTAVIFSLFGLVALIFLLLSVLRVVRSGRERAFEEKKDSLKPLVKRLIDSDVTSDEALRTLEGVTGARDRRALEILFLEAAPGLEGDRRRKLTFVSEKMGFIDEDIANLGRGRKTARAESAYHLGIMRSDRAVPALLAALGTVTDPDTVFACLNSLSHIGTSEAIEGVSRYIRTHENLQNLRLAEVLTDRSADFAPFVGGWLEAGEENTARLIFLLKVAGAFEDQEMLSPIAAYAAHGDPAVRATAAWALGRTGVPAACGTLSPMMSDADSRVRAEAAEALGKAGCQGSTGPLKEGLYDHDIDVRRSSAIALSLLGVEGRAVLDEVLSAGGARSGPLADTRVAESSGGAVGGL